MTPENYNKAYTESKEYALHYSKSIYLPLWNKAIDMIGFGSVYEIGCGVGQFAKMLYDRGTRDYVGVDFSSVAIEKARKSVPRFRFTEYDVTKGLPGVMKDTYVCLETLEHIEDDLKVLGYIPKGKRVILSVPNFDSKYHVRHFESMKEVFDRYSEVMTPVMGITVEIFNSKFFLTQWTR